MTYTAHPERITAFQRRVLELGLIHGTTHKHSPWENGFIERLHRTFNEECFGQIRFIDEEDRRYQAKLFEYFYNTKRPHQGIGNRVPFELYKENYRLHATARMLT